LRKAGKRIYIDTNIIVYAILHHSELGAVCERILRDANEGKFIGVGSYMVAIELLGSLSKIDPEIAWKATNYYLALPFEIHKIEETTISLAGIINTVSNMGYDAVHLAVIILNGIETVITNDLKDWVQASKNFQNIKNKIEKQGFEVKQSELRVLSPRSYKAI